MVDNRAPLGRLWQAGSLVLYLSIFSIIYFSLTGLGPNIIMDSLINFTVSMVVFFSKLIGVSATSAGNLLTISGFTLSIDPSCTALSIYAIFIAGVVAFPGYAPRYKLKGLFYGITFLILFNISRIIGISLVGAHFSRSVFDFIHIYIFQSAFVVFVCLAWLVWLKRDIFKSGQSAMFIGFAFVGTLGCILVMLATMKWYVGALSYVANSLNSTFNPALDISRYDNEIAFGYSGRLTGFRIYQHVFDSAIFFGLMLASSRGHALVAVLRRLAIGTLILIVMHLMIILFVGNLLLILDPAYSTDWIIRSISIVVPVLLWLKMKRGLTSEYADDKREEEVATAS